MVTNEKMKHPETLRRITNIIDDNGLDDVGITWSVETGDYVIHFKLYDIHLSPQVEQFEIGGVGMVYPCTHRWSSWFRFDETDIAYRHVDVEWWQKHKPILMAVISELEKPIPVNTPVKSSSDGLKDLAGAASFPDSGWVPANPESVIRTGVCYDEKTSPHYLKFKRLQKLLQLPKYQVIGVLEALFSLSEIHETGSFQEFADAIEWRENANYLAQCLKATGWIAEENEDGDRLEWLVEIGIGVATTRLVCP